jgi:hypothetical protein
MQEWMQRTNPLQNQCQESINARFDSQNEMMQGLMQRTHINAQMDPENQSMQDMVQRLK